MSEIWPGQQMIEPLQLAEAARVSVRVICNLIRAKKLEAHKIGGHWRIPRRAALELLHVNPEGASPTKGAQGGGVSRRRLPARDEKIVDEFLGR